MKIIVEVLKTIIAVWAVVLLSTFVLWFLFAWLTGGK